MKEKAHSKLLDIWSLLAYGIRALCMEREENSFVPDVQKWLDKAYVLWADFFGVRTCTYNTHHIHHLQAYYDLLGPLPLWSAFPYEGMYSHIREIEMSSRNVTKQVMTELYAGIYLKEHKRYILNMFYSRFYSANLCFTPF